MITDRDITTRAVAIGSDPARAMVHEVMTPGVLCCSESDEVEEATLIMQKNQVRRILVLNEADELVGITSIGELAMIMEIVCWQAKRYSVGMISIGTLTSCLQSVDSILKNFP